MTHSESLNIPRKKTLRIRILGAIVLLLVTTVFSGCRCSNCRNNNWFNPLSGFGAQRIAPPATYSFQPPNGQANPYYNPNSTATLPNNADPNANQNWQPANKSSATTTATNPYAYGPPAGYPTNMTTLASSTTNVRSTDFRTTSIDERNDPSRLPATDATIQPNRFNPGNNNWQFAQNRPIQIQGQYQYQAPRLYSVPNGVLANSSTAVNPNYNPNYANTGYYYNNQANGWQPTGQLNR